MTRDISGEFPVNGLRTRLRAATSLAALLLGAILIFCAVGAAHAATFTVTTTADDGTGSLRQAIIAANARKSDNDFLRGCALPADRERLYFVRSGAEFDRNAC